MGALRALRALLVTGEVLTACKGLPPLPRLRHTQSQHRYATREGQLVSKAPTHTMPEEVFFRCQSWP